MNTVLKTNINEKGFKSFSLPESMKETDIRPQEIFDRYLELSAEDEESCFSGIDREEQFYVACGSLDVKFQFTKNCFDYVGCDQCGTLYQTPRSPLQTFEKFYQDSVSSRYWAESSFLQWLKFGGNVSFGYSQNTSSKCARRMLLL